MRVSKVAVAHGEPRHSDGHASEKVDFDGKRYKDLAMRRWGVRQMRRPDLTSCEIAIEIDLITFWMNCREIERVLGTS